MKSIFRNIGIVAILFFNGCATTSAIKEDSSEIWSETKKVSRETWAVTKDFSKDVWNDSKKAVHEATAE